MKKNSNMVEISKKDHDDCKTTDAYRSLQWKHVKSILSVSCFFILKSRSFTLFLITDMNCWTLELLSTFSLSSIYNNNYFTVLITTFYFIVGLMFTSLLEMMNNMLRIVINSTIYMIPFRTFSEYGCLLEMKVLLLIS